MRRILLAIVLLGPLVLVLCDSQSMSQQPAQPKQAGVLAVIQKDMRVGLKELANGYQIQVMPGVELPLKVTEVGADYLVLEDMLGVTETRIPIYAIKVVVVTRLPKGK